MKLSKIHDDEDYFGPYPEDYTLGEWSISNWGEIYHYSSDCLMKNGVFPSNDYFRCSNCKKEIPQKVIFLAKLRSI